MILAIIYRNIVVGFVFFGYVEIDVHYEVLDFDEAGQSTMTVASSTPLVKVPNCLKFHMESQIYHLWNLGNKQQIGKLTKKYGICIFKIIYIYYQYLYLRYDSFH